MLSERSQTKEDILYNSFHTKFKRELKDVHRSQDITYLWERRVITEESTRSISEVLVIFYFSCGYYMSLLTLYVFIIHEYITCCWFSVTKSCPTLCDPVNCSTTGFPILHYLPDSPQTHVHWITDTIKPSGPLLSPTPLALNLLQHLGICKWVSSLHKVAKVLELQPFILPMRIQGWFL